MDRLVACLVHHQLDSPQAKHVGDLVRIHEHACRPMRGHRADKLGHRHHAALNVHMRVEQARHQVSSPCIDYLRTLTDGMTGILADISNVAFDHRDICARDDLPGLHTDPLSVPDDQVGG
jgi:hypothetical protein